MSTVFEASYEELLAKDAEIERLAAELTHIHKDRRAWANVELSEENDRLIEDNEKLRAALKRCATKLERCAIAGGTDPEFAAEAVKEFRALEQPLRNFK